MNQPTVSDNRLEYIDFVLYLKRNDFLCEQLNEISSELEGILTIFVEDVKERPPWLVGVPTMVGTKSMEILKGTQAINKIHKIKDSAITHFKNSSFCEIGFECTASEAEPPERSLQQMIQMRS